MNITVKADLATLKAASDIYTGDLNKIKAVEGITASFTLQPYAATLLKASAASGGNSLGLGTPDGSLVSVLLLTYWKHKSDDDIVLGFIRVHSRKSSWMQPKKARSFHTFI